MFPLFRKYILFSHIFSFFLRSKLLYFFKIIIQANVLFKRHYFSKHRNFIGWYWALNLMHSIQFFKQNFIDMKIIISDNSSIDVFRTYVSIDNILVDSCRGCLLLCRFSHTFVKVIVWGQSRRCQCLCLNVKAFEYLVTQNTKHLTPDNWLFFLNRIVWSR